MVKKYKYIGYVFMLLIPLVFLAFYKTYFIHFTDSEKNIKYYVHLHAAIASLWILLLIIQPILISKGNFGLHKKLGKISYVIFPLLILSFIPMMNDILNSENINFLFFPLADCITLILFYSLAIINRRNSSKHMRFMIGTTITFLGPTIGRIGPSVFGLSGIVTQNLQYVMIYMILLSLIFFDKKSGSNFAPYVLIFAVWIIHQVAFNLIF